MAEQKSEGIQNEQTQANDNTVDRPEIPEYYTLEPQLTYTDEELDKKWFGVPPNGSRPLPERTKYVLMIIGIIILEISIWAVYRWSTAELFQNFGTYEFYLLHIIAAPTIHLLPILAFWKLVRKESGHPFVFTKKLLLTGIIVGFLAAILWRLMEEGLYDAFATAAGGTAPDTFTFLNVLDEMSLFMLMTFVMYFIVGPVEELEFRGFVQDQGARVLPNLQAVILSSVLFGCSHIPIAIFIYQFTPTQFVDALVGWIAAGFTFGFLYMWSRNIFACIVMHGMGNWQLSVFYFLSASTGMAPFTSMGVGIATSLVSNALMILVFYAIFKFYWEPHRHGEPAFRGLFMRFQKFTYDHDFERKPIITTVVVFVAFIVIVSGIIFGLTKAFGSLEMPNVIPNDGGGSTDLDSLVEVSEVESGAGTLQEGQSTIIGSYISQEDHYISSVSVVLTWTDEPDIQRVRTYENDPDTFNVTVSSGNMSSGADGSNPHGGQGQISATLSFSKEQIWTFISEDNENYQVDVEIFLVEAGELYPNVGVIGYTDNSNEYNYEILVTWLSTEEFAELE